MIRLLGSVLFFAGGLVHPLSPVFLLDQLSAGFVFVRLGVVVNQEFVFHKLSFRTLLGYVSIGGFAIGGGNVGCCGSTASFRVSSFDF